MFRIISVELYKLLHKRSIYIIFILMIVFCFFNNYLYYKDYDKDGFYLYEDKTDINKELKTTLNELKKYDYHKDSELSTYILLKTNYDILLLKSKYKKNTWQYRKMNEYMYDIIFNKNDTIYRGINNTKYIDDYNTSIDNINSNNWKYFINIIKRDKENNLDELKKEFSNTNDKKIRDDIKKKIDSINIDLKIINYRINNNVSENLSYLDDSLNKYKEAYNSIHYYEEVVNKTNKDKINYNNALRDYYINKFILDNKININKENTINNQLRTILSDYELFFVILVIIIGSSIICDEFTSGTIKLLLIKPYSRGKILIGKYFTCVVLLLLSIIFIVMVQLIIGNIFFDISDLKVPVVIYNLGLKKIVRYNIFKYMFINIIYKLPLFIMLLTITFGISVIFNSNIISFVVSIILYMTSSLVEGIAVNNNIIWMKYLLTLNWDLTNYLFGNVRELSYLDLRFSLLLIIFYYVIILVSSLFIFDKKNIKNV